MGWAAMLPEEVQHQAAREESSEVLVMKMEGQEVANGAGSQHLMQRFWQL
jgi:hypothetical protein